MDSNGKKKSFPSFGMEDEEHKNIKKLITPNELDC